MSSEVIACPNCGIQNRVSATNSGRPVCSQCWAPLKSASHAPVPETPSTPPSRPSTPSGKPTSANTGCWVWLAIFVGGWVMVALVSNKPSRSKYSPPSPVVDTRPVLIPQPLINHAVHSNLTDRAAVAPFAINTSGTGYFFVKLVDVTTGADAFVVFVHAGIPVEVDVPLGRYELRYAAGTTWYGIEHMFGYDTVYSKASTVLEFSFDGRRYEGHTVTLYLVRNGNMRTERIDKGSF